MVEVFKTNVPTREVAENLIGLLQAKFPGHRVTFDLEDCDKIMRIDGTSICVQTIVGLLGDEGLMCQVLN